MKTKHKTTGYILAHGYSSNRLWVSIHAGKDLSKYYIWLCHTRLKSRFKIVRPTWDAHVSLVRGELPFESSYGKQLDNMPIELEYEHEIYRAGRHFCMNVTCPKANALRVALGLSSEPLAPFHLTIGVLDGNHHMPEIRMTPSGEQFS